MSGKRTGKARDYLYEAEQKHRADVRESEAVARQWGSIGDVLQRELLTRGGATDAGHHLRRMMVLACFRLLRPHGGTALMPKQKNQLAIDASVKTWKPKFNRGFMQVFKGNDHNHGLHPHRIRQARATQLQAVGWPVEQRRDKRLRTKVWVIPDQAYETIWEEVHRLAGHHPEWGTVSDMLRAVADRLAEGATIYRLTGSTGKLYDWLCEAVKDAQGIGGDSGLVETGEATEDSE